MKPAIIFIPSKYNHWKMYLPIAGPLTDSGIDVGFVSLPAFFKINGVPSYERLDGTNIWMPILSGTGLSHNKLKMFYCAYHSLLPAWRKYLGQFAGGAVVVAQDGGPIQRLLLNAATQLGFKSVVMQDGFFVDLPHKSGWESDSGIIKIIMKRVLCRTPLELFVTRGWGAGSEYACFYGNLVRKKVCNRGIFDWDKTRVTGSPRHAIFKNRVKSKLDRPSDSLRILCLPTAYPYDPTLYALQDEILSWLFNSFVKFKARSSSSIFMDVKVKMGYDEQIDRYRRLFDDPAVVILSGGENLETLMANAKLVVTTGSTAALEAALCGKQVFQMAHPCMPSYFRTISGLPIARSESDTWELLKRLLEKAVGESENRYISASEELADLDPAWDSIARTAEWLSFIAQKI